MIERIQHAIDGTSVTIEIPQPVLDHLPNAYWERICALDGVRRADKIHNFSVQGTDAVLEIDYARLGRMDSNIQRGNALKTAVSMYVLAVSYPGEQYEDPALHVDMSIERDAERFRMYAWVRPAEGISLGDLSEHVTAEMQKGAAALRHVPYRDISSVAANLVSDEQFVLSTNSSMAEAVLSTDGMMIRDTDGRVEMTAGNFYSRGDQLVALRGLVAMARGE